MSVYEKAVHPGSAFRGQDMQSIERLGGLSVFSGSHEGPDKLNLDGNRIREFPECDPGRIEGQEIHVIAVAEFD